MNLKMMLLATVWAVSVSPALAQTPSDETVQRYIDLTEVEKMLDISHDITLQRNSETMWQDFLPKPTAANQTIRNQFIDVISEFDDNVKKRVHTPEMRQLEVNAIKRALKQNYTQEELDALIQFYDSPIGRQILGKQAVYYEQTSRDLSEVAERAYRHAIKAEFPATAKKIQRLGLMPAPKVAPPLTQSKPKTVQSKPAKKVK